MAAALTGIERAPAEITPAEVGPLESTTRHKEPTGGAFVAAVNPRDVAFSSAEGSVETAKLFVVVTPATGALSISPGFHEVLRNRLLVKAKVNEAATGCT